MAPNLTWGPLSVSAYRLLRVTAVVVLAVGLAVRLRRGRWPVTGWDVLLAIPFLQVGLLLGASLEVAMPYLVDFLLRGAPLPSAWWDGRRWLGALAGGALAGYLVCRFRRLPAGRCFDLFAVPLPLALAVARVGCLLQGCCYGREAAAWPALLLPDVHGLWASRYPTQLADILANLLIFFLLVFLERRAGQPPPHPNPASLRSALNGGFPPGEREQAPLPWGRGRVRGKMMLNARTWPFDGFLFLLFVGLHCGQRFVFEFWRADAPPLAGPFGWTHLYCVVGMGLAAWGMARGLRQVGRE